MPVEISPGTTFIIGLNGSGKSTVAIAIQLALGQKLTKPADQSWGVVRTGAANAEAIVEVEIHNGPTEKDPEYRPKVYGDSIIIRRRIVYNPEKCSYSTDKTETLAGPYNEDNPKAMKVRTCHKGVLVSCS
jgi:chromosome segregation ATPase